MKKKLSIMAVTALFAVGLAFHANNLNAVNSLLDSNVEALSDGESNTPNPYYVFGEYPYRITVDTQTHMVVYEGKRQSKDEKGHELNGCEEEYGATCNVCTATTVYNVSQLMASTKDFLEARGVPTGIIDLILSLFKLE